MLFFDVFWGRLFFAPGRHLGAQSARKGSKREPKVMKKEVRRHLVEHAKTMAGIVREAYGEIPGRFRNHFFRTRRRGLFRTVPGGVSEDFS